MKIYKSILISTILLLYYINSSAQVSIRGRQANLNHGQYTNSSFNFSGQTTILSSNNTEIVGGNEVTVGDLGNWDSGFTSAGLSRAIFDEHPSGGDGNAIWYKSSTITPIQTYTHDLANGVNPTSGSSQFGRDGTTDIRRSVVAAKFSKSGKQFYVVSVHFCASVCSDDTSGSRLSVQRNTQASNLVSWVDSTLTGGLPVIVIGDFNFAPDNPKSPSGFIIDNFILNGYTDVWDKGLAEGKATANWGDRDLDTIIDMPIGYLTTRTLGSRRLDYAMIKGSFGLTSIDVADLRSICSVALTSNGNFKECPDVTLLQDLPEDQGIRPSDHNWIEFVITLFAKKCNFHTIPSCN